MDAPRDCLGCKGCAIKIHIHTYIHVLDQLNVIYDLGVLFDSNLSFKDHITHKINKAYSILGIIKRNFIYMDELSFISLYKSMVRPTLEYAHSVWCPYKIGDIKEIEKVQKEQ